MQSCLTTKLKELCHGISIFTNFLSKPIIDGKNIKLFEDPIMSIGDGKHLCFKRKKIFGGLKLLSNLIACGLANIKKNELINLIDDEII